MLLRLSRHTTTKSCGLHLLVDARLTPTAARFVLPGGGVGPWRWFQGQKEDSGRHMTVCLSHAPLRRVAWLGGVSASALMVAGVLAATAAHAAGTDLAGANLIENFNASMVDPSQPYTNSGAAATLTLQPNGAGIIVQENTGAI